MRKLVVMGVIVAAAAAVGQARADILVGSNGLIIDGKIVSRDAKTIEFRQDGSPDDKTLHIDPAHVARTIVADEHGAAAPDESQTDARRIAKWKIPPEPEAPEVVVAPAGKPSYYLIPLHGAVGETVVADALEKSLADAVKRKATVVVLDIDSPGGLVEDARRILKVLHKYNKKLRIVALVDKDLSAAAILTLSVKEIYIKSSGTIGAATSFIPGKQLSAKVEEKMQSAWRASARGSAEEGGHNPLLAEAMIDNDLELQLEKVNGKSVVKQGPGDNVLCRKGKVLTLTSHEAVECGLAAGEADDLDELADALKMPGWVECKGLGTLLAEYLPKRDKALKLQADRIFAEFQQNIVRARQNAPSDEISQTFVRNNVGGRIVMSGSRGYYQPGQTTVMTQVSHEHWHARSVACVVALQQAEANLAEGILLCTTFGQEGAADLFREGLTDISAFRARIYDDRNKFGYQTRPAAMNAPGPASIPISAQPAPQVAPPRQLPRVLISNDFRIPRTANVPGTVTTGHGGTRFCLVNVGTAPVTGVRCKVTQLADGPAIADILPLFDRVIPSTSDDIKCAVAKDGYVVVGIVVASDQTSITGLQLIFAKVQGTEVDLNDTYKSDWIGKSDASTTRQLDCGINRVAIGFFGRRTSVLNSITLIANPAR
jgi:hypothetical protein